VPVDDLRHSTAEAPTESLTVIGDCITPRRISHAIAEGYRTGAAV
jgi:2,4-dienoyl-CoA reductase (NADPH2)